MELWVYTCNATTMSPFDLKPSNIRSWNSNKIDYSDTKTKWNNKKKRHQVNNNLQCTLRELWHLVDRSLSFSPVRLVCIAYCLFFLVGVFFLSISIFKRWSSFLLHASHLNSDLFVMLFEFVCELQLKWILWLIEICEWRWCLVVQRSSLPSPIK